MRIDPAFRTAACISHGGNLGEAVRRYRIQRGPWIDLSTGINHYGFPIPAIDPAMLLRLPDDDDGLEALAARHYRANHALAVAGTQAAIRLLPALLPKGPVGIGLLTYGEYARAFTQAGFPVEYFVTQSLTAYGYRAPFTLSAHAPLPGHLKHLIVVNPNNPTADLFDTDALLDGRRQLLVRGGTLIVDEAFIDATPQYSIAPASAAGHLIVLRSVGKFFGLAGARVGFVLSDRACIDAMRRLRGPWPLSGPARALARAALLDSDWLHTGPLCSPGHLTRAPQRCMIGLRAMRCGCAVLRLCPVCVSVCPLTKRHGRSWRAPYQNRSSEVRCIHLNNDSRPIRWKPYSKPPLRTPKCNSRSARPA